MQDTHARVETIAASSDLEAWRRFGGRHDLGCWLSKTLPRDDGTRGGPCFCGLACRECAESHEQAVALGLYAPRDRAASDDRPA